ncbi:MAG TPA: PEP-CTERM sorting domain-containing protein [Terriglobales bacterium]|nr:PEP-CTERM sorting domain-containing protein [Terriglobales bacterium]
MKRFVYCSVVVALLAIAIPISATVIPPFTQSPGLAPDMVGGLPTGNVVADTGAVFFHFGTPGDPNKNTGYVDEAVFQDANTGFLSFVFQILVLTGDIKTISIGDWDNSIFIDAHMTPNTGTLAPQGVDRNGFGTVGINFNPLVTSGITSYAVILETQSTAFIDGGIGLIDTGSSPTIPGFVAVATPEPATLSLLGFGLLGLGTLRKRR